MTAPHARPADEVLADLEVSPDAGLSEEEAQRRLERDGPNRLSRQKPASAWRLLVEQFESMVIILLAVAAAASLALGEIAQGIAIFAAILINTAIGFYTELRARRSMEALLRMEQASTTVRRDGKDREVPADEIVRGDIIVLERGSVIPADLRLVEVETLRCNEAALTGESMPVDKTAEPLEGEPPLAERHNMAFKGTSVARGEGTAVVVATGMETELGRISELAAEAGGGDTPLERRLDRLGTRLVWLVVAIAAVIAVIGILIGRDLSLMIETAVALAVAAVPEGLPVVASVALARGMWRMARRNAVIKQLAAVETLGAVTVILSDKTGTLTLNRMTVRHYALPDEEVDVERDESAGTARFRADGRDISLDDDPVLAAAVRVGSLCNGAELGETPDDAKGDPMEVALLRLGREVGRPRPDLLETMPVERVEEFERDTMMMATWHRAEGDGQGGGQGGGLLVAVKGAPDRVLEVSTRVMGRNGGAELTDEDRDAWLRRNEEMAGEGWRMLALAQKRAAHTQASPYEDLTFIGLVALVDPPREDAAAAVRACRDAGIRVIMLTGDQPATARAIAEAVGLYDAGDDIHVVHGRDLQPPDKLSDEQRERLLQATVFARVSPEQKLNLVKLFQDAGRLVAMTGDGVNDSPALKQADIGVAMGQRGTDVAREAADMVLKDDAFSTIEAAVEQGRTIFNNIRRFIVYLLSGNAGEILAISIASFAGMPLPLLPLQILFINIVSDAFPALALGVGPETGNVMQEKPRDPEEPIVARRQWGAIAGYGALIGGCVLAVFVIALYWLQLGETMAVTISFLTFGFARLVHVFNMRDIGSGLFVNSITRNPYVWGALVIGVGLMLSAIFVPGLSDLLQVELPGPTAIALIAAGTLAPLVIVQVWKAIAGLGRSGQP